MQVYDEDKMQADTKLGLAKVPLLGLELEKAKERTLKLERSLDPLKNNRDKKERGTITVKVRRWTWSH
jgi:FtsZ-binding cell division protein ZapB